MFKKFLESSRFYFLLVILLTLPVCAYLWNAHLMSAHDSMAGYIRAMSMHTYMGHGQGLVRWAPDLNWGYGYPMFSFYPPLFSAVAVMIFQVTHNMVIAMHSACVLFWVLSAVGMFLWAREFWGNEGGFVSALLYAYAPYHCVDLYVRGAFAEFSAFAFFPFIVWAIFKISRGLRLRYFIIGVVSVFGLSLAHNIMSLLFFPIAGAYMLYVYFFEIKSSWILSAMFMFVLGLMLSAFFWLPALVEKQYLNLNFLIAMRYDFHKSFISLSQLFWPLNHSSVDGISFRVGILSMLTSFFSLGIFHKALKVEQRLRNVYVFFLIIGVMTVFLTLESSRVFWEHLPLLRFVQFPWRILTLIVFVMAFLGGGVVMLVRDCNMKKIMALFLGVGIVWIYGTTIPKPTFVTQETRIEDFIALGEGEYTPRWIQVPPNHRPERKFEIVEGLARVGQEQRHNPVDYTATVEALRSSSVCFHVFYFPGWQVFVDGQAVNPYTENPFGVIFFHLPAGVHDLRVVFMSTPLRVAGGIISWMGLIGVLGVILWLKKYPRYALGL